MTREQAENLPEFNERLSLDHDYEERVRGVYRHPSYSTQPLDTSTPLETRTPVEAPLETTPAYTRDTYRYEQEPSLYGLNEPHHETMKLYEERLIASKRRQKTGDVTVGKHVETETARVAVPVERERVVVERVTPEDAGRVVSPGEANFREGEVARVELHEETPDIRKEAVVREEIRVKKVVEQDTVESEETLRREELDINKTDDSIKERRM
jgi:uncharacterized protein (TIGR02271 family)